MYAASQRQQPLALAASKSWVGHAEPAAGMAGLLFAHAAATQSCAVPLLHLRAVNPYVVSSREQQQAGSASAAMLPRQGGALPMAAAGDQQGSIWGVSAFAFQGTNAHALLEAKPAEATISVQAISAAMCSWQHKRQYVLPEANALIAAASMAGTKVLFHADLAAASLAFLWDHRVMGKAIFPGKSQL